MKTNEDIRPNPCSLLAEIKTVANLGLASSGFEQLGARVRVTCGSGQPNQHVLSTRLDIFWAGINGEEGEGEY